MSMIQSGFKFWNESMALTVVSYYEDARKNIALVQRTEDGMYITVRDLTHNRGDYYYWHYGHYFPKNQKTEALEDFESRKKDI